MRSVPWLCADLVVRNCGPAGHRSREQQFCPSMLTADMPPMKLDRSGNSLLHFVLVLLYREDRTVYSPHQLIVSERSVLRAVLAHFKTILHLKCTLHRYCSNLISHVCIFIKPWLLLYRYYCTLWLLLTVNSAIWWAIKTAQFAGQSVLHSVNSCRDRSLLSGLIFTG